MARLKASDPRFFATLGIRIYPANNMHLPTTTCNALHHIAKPQWRPLLPPLALDRNRCFRALDGFADWLDFSEGAGIIAFSRCYTAGATKGLVWRCTSLRQGGESGGWMRKSLRCRGKMALQWLCSAGFCGRMGKTRQAGWQE